MKNILNVNKISLKPIFMSLAILFTIGASSPHFFEKVVNASYSDSQTLKIEEEEEVPDSDDDGSNNNNAIVKEEKDANEISVYPLNKILIANCGEVICENIKVENSRSEYEVEIEEEEEDIDDYCNFFVPEDNRYCDEQAKKAWEEFHNTLFGEKEEKASESSNDLCPSIFKCSLT